MENGGVRAREGLGEGGLGIGGPGEGVSCVLFGREGSGQFQHWPNTEIGPKH